MPKRNQFTEEELEELLIILRARWTSGDSVIRKFVGKVGKLQKKNKMRNVFRSFEELMVRLIAEYLKRLTRP